MRKTDKSKVWAVGSQVHHKTGSYAEVIEMLEGTGYGRRGTTWIIQLRYPLPNGKNTYRLNSNDRRGWHLVGSATADCDECRTYSGKDLKGRGNNFRSGLD